MLRRYVQDFDELGTDDTRAAFEESITGSQPSDHDQSRSLELGSSREPGLGGSVQVGCEDERGELRPGKTAQFAQPAHCRTTWHGHGLSRRGRDHAD
jgi:hypothetical protein